VVISVWASLRRLDPHVENAAVSLGAGGHRATADRAAAGHAGVLSARSSCSRWRRVPSRPGDHRRPAASGRGDAGYDEFLNTLNWPLGAAIAVLLVVANVVIVVGCNRLIERRYARVFE